MLNAPKWSGIRSQLDLGVHKWTCGAHMREYSSFKHGAIPKFELEGRDNIHEGRGRVIGLKIGNDRFYDNYDKHYDT